MNQPQPQNRAKNSQRRKSKRGGQQRQPDLWRTPPSLPEVEPIGAAARGRARCCARSVTRR